MCKINILLIGIIVIVVLATSFQTVSATVTWSYYDVTAAQAFDPATYVVPYGNTVEVTACSGVATGGGWSADFTWNAPGGSFHKDNHVAVDVDGCVSSEYSLAEEGSWTVDVHYDKGSQHNIDPSTSAIIDVGVEPVPEFPYGIAILIFSSSLTYLVMRKWRKPR